MSTDPFDIDRPWQVDPRVSMRPEPFGALLYHFGTRRLSFLKNQRVLAVVQSLADHPSARAACAAAGVPEAELPGYARALAALADSSMISERTVVLRAPEKPLRRRGTLPPRRAGSLTCSSWAWTLPSA